jgi:G patch domain-containing protein 1
MDETDMVEFSGGKRLKTTEMYEEGSRGSLLPKESVGWKLLKKMGYKGDQKTPVVLTDVFQEINRTKHKEMMEEKESKEDNIHQISKSNEAFGTGVFEEDDEDIYAAEREDKFDRVLYTEEDRPVDKVEKEPENVKMKVLSSLLDLFVLGESSTVFDKWYEAPKGIPNDYKSKRAMVNNEKPRNRFDLNPHERGKILGEDALPGSNLHDDDKLEKDRKDYISNLGADKFKLESSVAQQALQGFIPFKQNPEKQFRYKQYLNHFAYSYEMPQFPEDYTAADEEKELAEFHKAAQIFRPLMSSMAARFTSAKGNEELVNTNVGLKSINEYEKVVNPNMKEETRRELESITKTRMIYTWVPSHILIKRFNIKDAAQSQVIQPSNTAPSVMVRSSKSIVSSSSLEMMLADHRRLKGIETEIVENQVVEEDEESPETKFMEKEMKNDVKIPYENETRPSMDLFRDIFGTDETNPINIIDHYRGVKQNEFNCDKLGGKLGDKLGDKLSDVNHGINLNETPILFTKKKTEKPKAKLVKRPTSFDYWDEH